MPGELEGSKPSIVEVPEGAWSYVEGEAAIATRGIHNSIGIAIHSHAEKIALVGQLTLDSFSDSGTWLEMELAIYRLIHDFSHTDVWMGGAARIPFSAASDTKFSRRDVTLANRLTRKYATELEKSVEPFLIKGAALSTTWLKTSDKPIDFTLNLSTGITEISPTNS